MYRCLICNKSLSSSENLAYHLENKVCQKPDKTCPLCNKIFRTKQNCLYHMSRRVCLRASKPKLVLKSTYQQMSKNDLIAQVTQLRSQLAIIATAPMPTPASIPTSMTPITETTHQAVSVPVDVLSPTPSVLSGTFPAKFGSENLEHIQEQAGDLIGPLLKNHTYRSITALFIKIHNNEKLPEYHNVCVTSERSGYALVSDGSSFRYRPKKVIVDQIIEDTRSMLNEYIEINLEQLGDKVVQKFENYQDQLDTNTEFQKALDTEIGGLLLDMKDVITSDEKTRQLLDKAVGGLDLVESVVLSTSSESNLSGTQAEIKTASFSSVSP